MLFLTIVLLLTTLLLCYAGYVFLIVDKRETEKQLENPELFDELDDKDYHFDLPAEVDEYEEVRASKPTDKCAGHSEPAQTGAAATCLSLETPGSRERELGSACSDCRG